MTRQSDGTVTHWIIELKDGDEGQAQEALWNRYFQRMVALARKKLAYSTKRVCDEEDVAIQAAKSFFEGVREGQFPLLRDRTNLWPLLAKITARKAVNQIVKQNAKKRGAGMLHGVSDLPGDRHDKSTIEDLVGIEPTDEFMLEMIEQLEYRLSRLNDNNAKAVVELKLQGYRRLEISQKLGVTERTVDRKLRLIREMWEAADD